MIESTEATTHISENGITQLSDDDGGQYHIFSDETNGCVLEAELKFGDGTNSGDEDELNTTNSSLAYLTQVRKKRKKSVDMVPRRTCTTRTIAFTGIGFLVICLVMVGVSLLMSKDIDALGKHFQTKLYCTIHAISEHNTETSPYKSDPRFPPNI